MIIDFDSQYHIIRQLWGDRKINVPRLVKFFLDQGPQHFIGVARVFNGSKSVERFDRLLDSYGFDRAYLVDPPRNTSCSALVGRISKDYYEPSVVSWDPTFRHIPGVYAYSFGWNLPEYLITPLPAESHLELSHDLE